MDLSRNRRSFISFRFNTSASLIIKLLAWDLCFMICDPPLAWKSVMTTKTYSWIVPFRYPESGLWVCVLMIWVTQLPRFGSFLFSMPSHQDFTMMSVSSLASSRTWMILVFTKFLSRFTLMHSYKVPFRTQFAGFMSALNEEMRQTYS